MPPPPASRSDRVYEAIAASVFDGRLPAGTRLAEDRLGEIFGVSRTVVRAALHRLGHAGIVTLQPNRGACVAMPDVEEARDVFEARRCVEDTVVRRAAERLRPVQLRRLRGLLARERAAASAGNRPETVRLSGAFHLLLGDFAGNRVLATFLHELVARTSLILSLHAAHDGRACATEEHAAILDALAAKDAEAVARLMDRHLRGIEAAIDLDAGTGGSLDLAGILRGPAS